ncbi:hypothetical protein OPQ81_011301 [Rhizoctonia solani]|nr:hypothetical protein OPQ81_011301 [Rhizoctonia solani]
MALPIPGPYLISLRNDNCLTMQDQVIGDPLTLMLPTGNPGEQEWHLDIRFGDSITLRNIKSGRYVGVHGEPKEWCDIVVTPGPFQFKLEATGQANSHFIYVESNDQRFYMNPSPVNLDHRRCVLTLQPGEPWQFKFME